MNGLNQALWVCVVAGADPYPGWQKSGNRLAPGHGAGGRKIKKGQNIAPFLCTHESETYFTTKASSIR